MSVRFSRILERYNFSLPEKFIAQTPAHPRDSARLLVYDRKTKKVQFDRFLHLPKYLPPRAVLVFNDTKVFPARLTVYKETGGRVKLLYLQTIKNRIEVLADRKIEIGSKLLLPELGRRHTAKKLFDSARRINFIVVGKKENHYFLKPSFPASKIAAVLQKYGETPIPPYIKHSPLSEKKLREEYQTIFAKVSGSVAAPTASLHFTKQLFKKLKSTGIDIKFVTLHVGLGTFAPLTEKNIKTEKLHEEWYEIDKATAKFLNHAKKEGRTIIAVGTTSVRTLESAVAGKVLKKSHSGTQLFIREGYEFKFIDGMITNFHVSRSSLLMLVSALIGRKKLFELYSLAMRKKFRFFSFGDGMLIK